MEMAHACVVGSSDMRDFTTWWERHLPACLIVYCAEGETRLTIQIKPYRFRKGMVTFISPDMYPSFTSMTDDFKAFYCLMGMDFADWSFYDIPGGFFDAVYAMPVLPIGEAGRAWFEFIGRIYEDEDNAYRQNMLSDLLHAFTLDCHARWMRAYGESFQAEKRTSAETICMKFYDLICRHFKEHRDTAFYADKLCVTPCYLAMVTRRICQETPKRAIDRQVTLEMKYVLRNTSMTVSQIADYLHFPDTSYMCRYFRRQTGLSLSEYRKDTSLSI